VLLKDVRWALRMVARSPGYVAMAVIALGLGIGANTTVFSFVNAYLLQPLPSVKNADRLVTMNCLRRGNFVGVSYLDFVDWKQQGHAFGDLVAANYLYPILTGQGKPDRLNGVRVSGGFFEIYTVRPAIGRSFLTAENLPGGEAVVLLSQGFWQRRFGGDPDWFAPPGLRGLPGGRSCDFAAQAMLRQGHEDDLAVFQLLNLVDATHIGVVQLGGGTCFLE